MSKVVHTTRVVTLADHADLKPVAQATAARETAEQAWRDAIISAHAAGQSTRIIAEVAGVSHTRIAEIVRDA
jgi:hypothetical protein